MNYRIFPPEDIVEASIALPLSKSISNRILIINALAGGDACINEVAKCDDTDVMASALHTPGDKKKINIGAAGTAMRFLTAYYAGQPGVEIELDGSERMRHRPIAVLAEALRKCGAIIEYLDKDGYPPLKIKGSQLKGGQISLPASVSSQYISALLMIAPKMSDGLELTLEGDIVSRPYILMTLGIMKHWGISADFEGNMIKISPQNYKPAPFTVEADWSAASYWYEIEALSAGAIYLRGLFQNSLQGDSALVSIFENLGVNSYWNEDDKNLLSLMPSPDPAPRIETDMSEQPDLAQTVAVTACMLGIPFHITGLSTLRIKETDRLEALKNELGKLSFDIDIDNGDSITWEGRRMPLYDRSDIHIDTYDDHRMAMAFAPTALYLPGIVINNAEVVSKSYPGYWDDLRNAGFIIEEVSENMENIL